MNLVKNVIFNPECHVKGIQSIPTIRRIFVARFASIYTFLFDMNAHARVRSEAHHPKTVNLSTAVNNCKIVRRLRALVIYFYFFL